MGKFLIIFLVLGTGLPPGNSNVLSKAVQKFVNIPAAIMKNLFYLDPEVTMSLPEMVNHYGYPLETHKVTTEDSYMLTNHRIPHGKDDKQADPDKLPVLLLHGINAVSDIWVFNTPNNSLGFLLADAGFDVWMINTRGEFPAIQKYKSLLRCNRYSKKHKTLKANQASYWDFSIDEVSYYDLAAFIDDVLNKTGKKQVYIVGHSLGASLAFTLLADRIEYNYKVKEIYALSPVGNDLPLFGSLSRKILLVFLYIVKHLGIHNFDFTNWILTKILGLAVKYNELVSKAISFLVLFQKPDSWNTSRFPIFYAHGQGGVAVNILRHLVQLCYKPQIPHFDWGKKKNMVKYNQSTPPDYDLNKATVPTHLYFASKDFVISKSNLEFLQKNLANVVSLTEAGHNWDHQAYLFDNNAASAFLNEMVASIVKNNSLP